MSAFCLASLEYSSGLKSLLTCLAFSTAARRSVSNVFSLASLSFLVSRASLNSLTSSSVAVPWFTLSNRLAITLSAWSISAFTALRSAVRVAVAASSAAPRLANPAAVACSVDTNPRAAASPASRDTTLPRVPATALPAPNDNASDA